MNVLLDTTPLGNASSIRGIGNYTRYLGEYLEKIPELTVKRSSLLSADEKFKPDLIHYPFFDLFFSTLPLLKTAKTVVTIHDVIPLKYPAYYPAGIRGQLKFIKQRAALKNVAAIITDSQASKKDLHQYLDLSLDKIKVVYLAGNPKIEPATTYQITKVRHQYHLPANYLLYVGDINYNKNLPQLIKALKFIPEKYSLVLVGHNFRPQSIPEWQWIETQIALSDVSSRLVFLTQILGDADQDLAAIYSGAKVYIQPSLDEGFGLPILEAMQAGTPVVCSRNSALIEVGANQVTFCEPTAESIARAVTEVTSWEESKRLKKIKAAQKWSHTFSWPKAAQETYQVYQDVIG